ncbi:unnamed protein product [Miscanthus lutarioriparius]|uniref:Uncharacterized protein n=1 Tax=Miscanthus lutarioriparius TaxID=422564 RepID=A0A811SLS7_9POAL|nr:unnamed protein product [Miscanthus lutarioriparius]
MVPSSFPASESSPLLLYSPPAFAAVLGCRSQTRRTDPNRGAECSLRVPTLADAVLQVQACNLTAEAVTLTQRIGKPRKKRSGSILNPAACLIPSRKFLLRCMRENDKPSSAVEFVQQKLGGPSISDYEKLKAEKLDLQLKYDKLLETHKETCRQLEELKNMKYGAPWN